MRVNIMLEDKIVKSSYNLRAILDYATCHAPILMHIFKESDDKGHLTVHYSNGATVDTTFEDYSVLQTWCAARMQHNENFAGIDYSEQ